MLGEIADEDGVGARVRGRSATSRRWRARLTQSTRVLAELCRRDLVPELWIASLDDRALCERLRRRTDLVRMPASATNRIPSLQTQWGLRVSLQRLGAPDAMTLLEQHGMPAVWRASRRRSFRCRS